MLGVEVLDEKGFENECRREGFSGQFIFRLFFYFFKCVQQVIKEVKKLGRFFYLKFGRQVVFWEGVCVFEFLVCNNLAQCLKVWILELVVFGLDVQFCYLLVGFDFVD